MKTIYNCIFLLLLLLFISCEKKEEPSQQQPQFANMKEYVEYKCSTCHSLTRVFEKARKPEEWSGIVRRMGRCNPQFVNEEVQQKTFEYLIKNEFVTEGGEGTQKDKTDTGKE